MNDSQSISIAKKPQSTFLLGLLLWLALMALLTAGIWLLYQNASQELQSMTRLHQKAALQEAKAILRNRLSIAERDIHFMAANPILKRYLADDRAIDRNLLGELLSDLMATRRGLYDQMRYLDERGMEVVRVNNTAQGTQVVPADQLQNKASRYYFKNSLGLPTGDVYISPFDLNVEHGRIEQPIKPTLRFGTRAVDSHGKARGVLVVNYLGRDLLDRLRAIRTDSDMHCWLANQDGAWLIGPNAESEWGFMYPGRTVQTLASLYPEAWQGAKRESNGQEIEISERGAMLAIAPFTPSADLIRSAGALHTDPGTRWYLVAETSPHQLITMKQGLVHRYGSAYIILAALFAGFSAWVAILAQRRRQALRDVAQHEHQFRSLLEAAPDAIVVSDADGRIVMANAQVESAFGLARAVLDGQKVETLMPERYRADHVQHRAGYVRAPVPRAMGQGRDLFALRKDGSEFPVSIALNTVDGPDGRMVISIIRDITEAHRNATALNEANQRLRIAADAGQIGIWDYDVVDNVLIWDDRMYQIYGVDRDRFSGAYEAWAQCVHPDDLADAAGALQAAIRGEAPFDTRFRIVWPDGSIHWIKAGATALLDDAGKVLRMIGTNMDITAEIQAHARLQEALDHAAESNRALQASNRELESFSYSVSHDLRAPLRAVDGFSNILLKSHADRLDDQGRDLLQRMRAAAQRMGLLIDDMLVLSRISRAELVCERFNLSVLAEDVVAQLRESFPEHKVEVSIQPGVEVEADPRLIRIVLDNLLGNAWKFTGKTDQARVEFGCEQHDDHLEFFIRDNGAGFDMAYADKLFSAFQRLHSGNDFPGTGIGLATVMRVIHKHGGEVRAEGSVGQGAVFHFTLPS